MTVSENAAEKPVADATSTLKPAEPAAEQQKQEVKTIALTPEDLEKVKEEARKEAREKYLAQVSKKDAEVKRLRAELEEKVKSKYDDPSLLEDVAQIAQLNLMEKEAKAEIVSEETKFFETSGLSEPEVAYVRELKQSLPALSWDSARKLYLAEKAPERLIANKTAPAAAAPAAQKPEKIVLPIGGSAPVSNSDASVATSETDKSKSSLSPEEVAEARAKAAKDFSELMANFNR